MIAKPPNAAHHHPGVEPPQEEVVHYDQILEGWFETVLFSKNGIDPKIGE